MHRTVGSWRGMSRCGSKDARRLALVAPRRHREVMTSGNDVGRAVICSVMGEPPSLAMGSALARPPGAGEATVAVHAAGVNFADTLMVVGRYQHKPPVPFTPGLEAAGIVTAIGPGVDQVAVGDRVLALVGQGAFADRLTAPAEKLHRIPDAMDFVTAAGFGVTYGTAFGALVWRARLQPGESLLITGAAGGVGLAAVEVGKALGASVMAAASSPEKLALTRAHGADITIDYKAEDLRTRLKELTGGKGVDVVLDAVGGDAFDAALRGIAWEGRIVVIGFAGGRIPAPPANLLLVKNCAALGFAFSGYREHRPEAVRSAMASLFDWWREGRLKPHVSNVLDLADYAQAFAALTGRQATGKLVLTTGIS
jgi:NADPH2:quinone reductase